MYRGLPPAIFFELSHPLVLATSPLSSGLFSHKGWFSSGEDTRQRFCAYVNAKKCFVSFIKPDTEDHG